MTYPPYLREKAREMRREKKLTIDEIAERLAVGRTTVYIWVYDMPRPTRAVSRQNPNQRRGTEAMQLKYRLMREQAYELGRWEFPRMCKVLLFRDFVCLYIAEGYKRSRNTVAVANSDAAAIKLSVYWYRQFSSKRMLFEIQFHADQRLESLQAYWAAQVGVPDLSIRFLRKSNSGQLAHRTWRSEHGVLSVKVHDTCFRCRLQGWIDCMREQWLDSLRFGA